MAAILCVGNLVSGFRFYGPFADDDEAIAYGEEHIEDTPTPKAWDVAPLLPPEADEADEADEAEPQTP